MFPLLIPMAVGAGAGALMKKDKPLQGAMMGAGLGAAGGAAMPALSGLLGGGTAAAPAAQTAGFGLGQPLVTGAMGESTIAGASTAGPGLEGLLGTANKYAPLMGAVSSFANSPGQPAAQAPAPAINQGGNEVLASLANTGRQAQDADLQSAAAAREARRSQRRGLL